MAVRDDPRFDSLQVRIAVALHVGLPAVGGSQRAHTHAYVYTHTHACWSASSWSESAREYLCDIKAVTVLVLYQRIQRTIYCIKVLYIMTLFSKDTQCCIKVLYI